MEGLFQLAMILTGVGALTGCVGLIGLIVTQLLGADKYRRAVNQWRNVVLYSFAFVGLVFCVGLGVCLGVG